MSTAQTNVFYREYDLDKARTAPSSKEPAEHQRAAIAALRNWFQTSAERGGLLVLPTGGGKTYTAVRFLCQGPLSKGYKVLWLAHTHHLLEQAIDSFGTIEDSIAGERSPTHGYEVGHIIGRSSPLRIRVVSGTPGHCRPSEIQKTDDVVIGTLQTIGNAQKRGLSQFRKFLKSAEGKLFVVFDEAHHAPAPTYRNLILQIRKEYPHMYVLGLTATPTYGDEAKQGWLKELFTQGIIYQVTPNNLMAVQILARPIIQGFKTNVSVDFDAVKYRQWERTYRDIPEDLIGELAASQERNSLIARTYLEHRERFGKTIIFADRWFQCEQIKVFLEEMSEKEAQKGTGKKVRVGTLYSHIDAKSRSVAERNKRSRDDNARALEAFRNDELDVIINIKMLTEGTDVPSAQTVFLTRQTTSHILLTQMVGRALRGPKFGGTDVAYIVSFIDDWKHLINWAEYDQLAGVPIPEEESWATRKRLPFQLISIDLLQQLIARMGYPDVLLPPFLTLLPVGWYVVEFNAVVQQVNDLYPEDDQEVITMQEQDDTELVQQLVLVFDTEQASYETFIDHLKNQDLSAFAAPEVMQLDEGLPLVEWWGQFFADIEERIGTDLTRNIFHIARHMAQHDHASPRFVSFEDRQYHDLDTLAQQCIDADYGPRKLDEFLRGEYDNDDRLWHAIYPSYQLFMAQYDACKRSELFRRNPPPMPKGVISTPEVLQEREPSSQLKKMVKQRDGIRCRCCGEDHPRLLEIDHLIPVYRGGQNKANNLQTLCGICNQHKFISEVNFLSFQTSLFSAPSNFPWLEMPSNFDQSSMIEWGKIIQRNINFFYQAAAVASIEVLQPQWENIQCTFWLYEGNDPTWIGSQIADLIQHFETYLKESQKGITSVSISLSEEMIVPPPPPVLPIASPSPQLVDQIQEQDGHCLCCHESDVSRLTVERIYPSMNDSSNLQTLCQTCQNAKGNRSIHFRQNKTLLATPPSDFLWSATTDQITTTKDVAQFLRRSINLFYQGAVVDNITGIDEAHGTLKVRLHSGNVPVWLEPHLELLLENIRNIQQTKQLAISMGIVVSAPQQKDVEKTMTTITIKPAVIAQTTTKGSNFIAVTNMGFIHQFQVGDTEILKTENPSSQQGDVVCALSANPIDTMLLFTNQNKVYGKQLQSLFDGENKTDLRKFFKMTENEKITTALALPKEQNGYLVLLTEQGQMTRIAFHQFMPSDGIRIYAISPSGMKIDKIPVLARTSSGHDEYMLVSSKGYSLRIKESGLPTTIQRTDKGFSMINIATFDRMIGLEVITQPNGTLITISERGYCKQTSLADYLYQERNSLGTSTFRGDIPTTGWLAAAKVVSGEQKILLITQESTITVVPINNIPLQSRTSQGKCFLPKLKQNDWVVDAVLVD